MRKESLHETLLFQYPIPLAIVIGMDTSLIVRIRMRKLGGQRGCS
jgi:hypothetical protein